MSRENVGNGFSKLLLSFKNVLGKHASRSPDPPPCLSTFQYLTLYPWKARIDSLEEDKNFSLTGFQIRSFLLFVKFDIMLVGRDEIQAPLKRPALEARRWQQV